MKKPEIILLNGPPGAGKDQIATFLRKRLNELEILTIEYKMSEPLKRATYALQGFIESQFEHHQFHQFVEQTKGSNVLASLNTEFVLRQPVLRSLIEKRMNCCLEKNQMEKIKINQRDFMIWLSEDVIKPMFGNDYFGKAAVNYFQGVIETNNSGIFVISDSGFYDESLPIVDYCCRQLGSKVHLWQIHRPGKTFEFDSRDYVDLSNAGVETTVIVNDQDLRHLENLVNHHLQLILS